MAVPTPSKPDSKEPLVWQPCAKPSEQVQHDFISNRHENCSYVSETPHCGSFVPSAKLARTHILKEEKNTERHNNALRLYWSKIVLKLRLAKHYRGAYICQSARK